MGKYNTVIFDLDGTLLNTIQDLADSVNYALRRFSFAERSVEEVNRFVGNGVRALMERAVPEGTPEETMLACLKIFKRHYADNMQNKTRPYEGILPLLEELKRRGVKTAVVSNKFDLAVKALCKEYFGDTIQTALGESGGVKGKPAPDNVFAALGALSAKKENALYVGDSEVDVKTAENAGIPCVGVAWGFRGQKLLEECGAACVIDRPQELLKLL